MHVAAPWCFPRYAGIAELCASDAAAKRAQRGGLAPPRALATRSISLGSATLDVPTEWQLTAGRGAPPPAAYTVNDGTAAADEKASAGGAPAGEAW